jgi:molybdopterin synthase sulfur carrier subunit
MKVNFFALLRPITGEKSVEIEPPADVRELILRLDSRYGRFKEALLDESGRLLPGVVVLVNGINVHSLAGLATPLSDSDTVSFFPPLGGG